MKKYLKAVLSAVCMLACLSVAAQKTQLSPAEIKAQSVAITEPVMSVKYWLKDKVILTTSDKKTFAADLKTGTLVSTEEIGLDNTNEFTVNIVNKDVYLNKNGEQEQLTDTPEEEKNPTLSPDNNYVAFTRNNDLYTIRLSDKQETRLTFTGSDVLLNGYASWVYMEEILGRASHYRAFWWSPDSKYLAFFHTDDSAVPLFYITDSPGQDGYLETLRYPKAGEPVPQVKTGIVNANGGEVQWVNVQENDSHYFGQPYWRPDSKALWVQWLNYRQDTLKILETDVATGTLREIYNETQPTWVAVDQGSRVRFLESGKGFILQSDKSGWNQLYLHDRNGKFLNAITHGNYTVTDVLFVDEKDNTVYFTAYKDRITATDFYKVGLNGKNLRRLSFGDYTHQISLSPDAKHFVTTYSNAKTPPKVALYTTNGKPVATLQDTKNENFDRYEQPETEMILLRSNDGLFDLPVRIIWPLNREKGKTYPVRLAIYGGPDTRSVYEGWSNAFGNESYQLANDGLIQAIIDHRGSGHNGKVGQNYMHRNFGYWETKDYTQIVQWLVEHGQADKNKIMITGFSYGGYMTCYALTYGAGVFTHGFAGGSVTDWLLYDAIYTERFMDTPAENPEGYKSASVLTHAEKLNGTLLMTHGLRDENVHVQNTFQLVSVLEDLQKDFQLLIYPESRHGYRGKKNQHYHNAELKFIYDFLLEKPLPKF